MTRPDARDDGTGSAGKDVGSLPGRLPGKAELEAFLAREFPQMPTHIDSVGNNGARVRHKPTNADLRPGGTVMGPVLMGLADVAMYVALLGRIGIVPLAVTSALTMHFLRKPSADRDILAECRLLKVGRSLAVGDVFLRSEGDESPVAHAVVEYAIPRASAPRAPAQPGAVPSGDGRSNDHTGDKA